MYIHNIINSIPIRVDNEIYNNNFLSTLMLPDDFSVYSVGHLISNNSDSNINNTVWLKNVDKLFELLDGKINFKNYNFYDIGCGDGICLGYVMSKYLFNGYFGIDIDYNLVLKSANLALLNFTAFNNVQFFSCDASTFQIKDYPSICFLFNPFGKKTLTDFISNNLLTFRKNKCIIFYVNDLYINDIEGHRKIIRDNYYNLSIIFY